MVVGINRGDKNCNKYALPSGRLFPTFNMKNGESTSSPDLRLTYTAHSSGGRGCDIYHHRLAGRTTTSSQQSTSPSVPTVGQVIKNQGAASTASGIV